MNELLPTPVALAVELLVDSLDALAVVMLLALESEQTWTAELVAGRLRIPLHVARRELDRAHARGLTAIVAGSPAGHRFEPDDDVSACVAQLVEFYEARRIDLINHVASRALRRFRSTVMPVRRRDGA